jgi:hypothetical protein
MMPVLPTRSRLLALTLACLTAVALAEAQGYRAIEFSTLSNFEYELPDPFDVGAPAKKYDVPAKVKALDGTLVELEGFMLPLDITPDGVSQFMLNASIDLCYFGAPVRMNEWVLVRMKGGTRAKFTHLATTVRGRFEVGEVMKNGRVTSLYRLEADSAEVTGR